MANRMIAAVLAVAALGGGCASVTRRDHFIATGVLLGGSVLLIANGVHNVNECRATRDVNDYTDGCEGAGAGSALLASAMIIGGLIAYFSAPDANEAPPVALAPPPAPTTAPRPAMLLPPPPTDDAHLRQLTLQAEVAARRGDCRLVAVVADQVEAIDAAYRRAGFVDDPRISTCLAAIR